MGYESNPLIDRLPPHLKQFIKPQDYEHYTPEDQAVWRFVMRQNVHYLPTVAHESYLPGIAQTGISVDRIPNMYGMNRILKKIGWAAVAVDGFIPPAAFMEFQAYKVLVIASEIRQVGHIQYTPAPDILHEGAGHAPIIANPEYAEYLRRFGAIGSKAISSAKDMELYHAVRELSILKEQHHVSADKIEAAERRVDEVQANMGEPSEMARIRNLHWWTVEYGLVGSLQDPRIYGAGLLSSIGESKWCMTGNVKKIPYSIEAAEVSFDITKPQPQLFVTPDFAYLNEVLEEFADQMALRKGGEEGLQRLIGSKSLGTIELSTGLQISGVFEEVISSHNKPVFVRCSGPVALAYENSELIGHGTRRYPNGFCSPLGKLKGINLAIEDMSPRDLQAYRIYEGKEISLEFEGDITVSGHVVTGIRSIKGKILLVRMTDCVVSHGDRTLFSPKDGNFDLAIGKEVVSAYNGPADHRSFDMVTHTLTPTPPRQIEDPIERRRLEIYQEIREIREARETTNLRGRLHELCEEIALDHRDQWLLVLEALEILLHHSMSDRQEELLEILHGLARSQPENAEPILNGLSLLNVSAD